MSEDKKDILIKAYIVCFLLSIIAFCIGYQLVQLQINPSERKKFEAFAQKTNFRKAVIPAARGNLYASDGSLLATSIRKYDIAIDAKSMNNDLVDEHLNALADSLHDMFGKPQSFYAKLIINAKKEEKQYLKIARNLDFQELKRISAFPIFNKGQIKGGFIVEDNLIRERSIKDIGSRTLGYVKGDSIKIGLEGAYNSLLGGTDGIRLEQRMGGGNWRPINIFNEVQAIDGQDVVTTIDIGLQNVAYNSLYDQLKEFEADHGTVVVMEVKTGEIKAIANLTRLADGEYSDIQNFAVGEANEPGSTIKTVSLLAALKDEVIDTSTTVETGRGRVRLFGRSISDSHANGTINARQVLEKSSNIGTAKLITKFYQDKPEDFFKIILDEWKLDKPLGVEIPGEATPYFPNPSSKSWSKQSLSSVSFGYETKLTPLQILTFYNGIANNGKMLKPLFVKEIREKGNLIKRFSPQVRVEKMADDNTIKKIQSMLAGAVKRGTGRAFYNETYPAAGKTGTARVEYWIKGPMQYRASFCGYFPTYAPRYSCIVVIHKPSTKKGYYGSSVAGPVFQKIMESVYIKSPKKLVLKKQKNKKNIIENKVFEWKPENKKIPNLIGYEGNTVIPALENAGFRVVFSGIGKVTSQSIPAGNTIPKNKVISLKLSR